MSPFVAFICVCWPLTGVHVNRDEQATRVFYHFESDSPCKVDLHLCMGTISRLYRLGLQKISLLLNQCD